MAAGNHALTIEQGATWHRTLYWRDANRNPINLTGYTANLQIKTKRSATSEILELTTAIGGGITITPLEGKIELDISDDDTADLALGKYVYDLDLISSGSETTRLLEGLVTIT